MVGNERGDAEALRARHTFDAPDAVVHGDEEVGLALRRKFTSSGERP